MATGRGTRRQPTTDGTSMKNTRAALYATNLYQMVFYNDCCAVDRGWNKSLALPGEEGTTSNHLKGFYLQATINIWP